MKTKIIGIIIVVLILIFGGYYVFIGTGDTVLEEENEAGNWGIKATVHYADGTTKVLNTGTSDLSISIEDKIVDKITFTLMSKMYGIGYTEGSIDLHDVNIFATITDDDTIIYNGIINGNLEIFTLSVDGQWHEIAKQDISATHGFLETHTPYNIGMNNIYKLEIKLSGSARYRGLPDGIWKSLTLPSPVVIQYEVYPDIIDGDEREIYCDVKFYQSE